MSNIDINQYEFAETSRKNKIKSAIEAMLFVAGEPLNIKDIYTNLELDRKTAREILNEINEEFKAESRGIKLINIDDSYQFVTKPENSEFIQKMLKKNKRQSLSQASIESLAIVAYKQPITRVDIDEIRGVKSESALQRLLERDLIKDVGRLEVPGRPILYGTTDEFLRQFGLQSLKELPSLDLYEDSDADMEIVDESLEEDTGDETTEDESEDAESEDNTDDAVEG